MHGIRVVRWVLATVVVVAFAIRVMDPVGLAAVLVALNAFDR
jgi:hypothetical protein